MLVPLTLVVVALCILSVGLVAICQRIRLGVFFVLAGGILLIYAFQQIVSLLEPLFKVLGR